MNSISYGAIIIFSVIYLSVFSVGDSSPFFNAHSSILVLGGCFGIFFLSTPFSTIRVLIKMLLGVGHGGPKAADVADVHRCLLLLAKDRNRPTDNPHPLILESQRLWSQGVEPDLFESLLSQRVEQLNQTSSQAVAAMRNLAKYPPSLGMIGTVVGLVQLFSAMNPNERSDVGPHLAVAMTATFYGLILANLVIMPLADRLHSAQLASVRLNDQIFQTLMLINRQEVQPLIENALRSYAS